MRASFRVYFLIVAAAYVLHLSFWTTVVVLFGYYGFDSFDAWLAKRAWDEQTYFELYGREPERDPEAEIIVKLARRLKGSVHVAVTRLAEDLVRIRLSEVWRGLKIR